MNVPALERLRTWALGVPKSKRDKRLVVSLVAFIDDSAQDQILVYAGYVARIGDWEKLVPKWQECLDMEPKLSYFKMKEAWGRNDEWRKFSIHERDRRVCQFYKIITEHVLGSVSVVLPVNVFKEVYASRSTVPRLMKNKHFFVMYTLMHDLLRFSERIGLDEPIDFVFDDQARGKEHIFGAWNSFSTFSPTPKHRHGSSPRFENDKDSLPVQAADFCAWAIRRNAMRSLASQPEEVFPWSNMQKINRIFRVWDKEKLIEHDERSQRIKRMAEETGLVWKNLP